jgi:glycosyltransferase involved in cell wall biosynthesis
MRILLLTEFYPPILGGLEVYVKALHEALKRRGHTVAVGTLECGSVSEPPADIFYLRSLSQRLPLAKDAGRPFLPPLRDPVLATQLRALLRAFEPEVIHSHNWIGASVPVARSAPLVHTAHDYSLTCPKRSLMFPDGTVCSGPSTKCFGCAGAFYGRTKGSVLTVSTRVGRWRLHADHYIAISRAVEQSLASRVAAPVTVIPTSLPDDLHHQAEPFSGLPAGKFAMYAGAPEEHKGIEILLDVWRTRRLSLPLVLALTRPYNGTLPAGVTALQLTREQVLHAFGKATVAVVPSLWSEPFGTVAAEALRMGTPVVSTAMGALPEIVEDGVTGLVVPAGDADALSSAISRVFGDPALARRLGREGRTRTRRFDMRAVLPRIEDVYRCAMSRSTLRSEGRTTA